MQKGITYMTRPSMQPLNKRFKRPHFSCLSQFGWASVIFTVTANKGIGFHWQRLGSERTKKLFGRFFSFSLIIEPCSTIRPHNSFHSFLEPSHHRTSLGAAHVDHLVQPLQQGLIVRFLTIIFHFLLLLRIKSVCIVPASQTLRGSKPGYFSFSPKL